MAEPDKSSAQGALVFQGHWERVKKEIEKDLIGLATHLSGAISETANRMEAVATGAMSGSFEPFSEFTPTQAFIGVGSPLWFGAGGYGAYVEGGTRPHWAPLEPIARWVEQKIQPHVLAVGFEYASSGKSTPVPRGTRVLRGDARRRAVLALARAIQIKIARKGTTAKPFVREAMTQLGLQWQLVPGGKDGESYYSIDIGAWLEGRLPAILERAQA